MKGYTITEFCYGAKDLAESFRRGDTMEKYGIPMNEVLLLEPNFALYVPYIPLQVTPIFAPSSNGKTTASETVNQGSNPCGAANKEETEMKTSSKHKQ